MPDAGGFFGGREVAAGRLEEFQHGLVFERRRVGDVDDDLGSGHGRSQAFAGDGVDAGGAGGGDDFVALVAEDADEFGADEAAAADDDDFHVDSPLVRSANCRIATLVLIAVSWPTPPTAI